MFDLLIKLLEKIAGTEQKPIELNITPAPDTVIRVFMVWKGLDTYVPIQAQPLTAPPRTGFTVVEWGGSLSSQQ